MPDQGVEVVAHDASWAASFAVEGVRVEVLLRPWLTGPVEHVGSTAVPGLPAKPVVDMLAPVVSLRDAPELVEELAADDWLFWPDDPGRHYRLWFLRPAPEARTHHLQVIVHDDPHARALIVFRDALRADAQLRDEYASLKVQLAAEHPGNRNAYTNGKADFVDRVLLLSGVELPRRVPLPE